MFTVSWDKGHVNHASRYVLCYVPRVLLNYTLRHLRLRSVLCTHTMHTLHGCGDVYTIMFT